VLVLVKILFVAVGGSIGAVSRYIVSNWAAEVWGSDFPYGTLIVNVVGCFIIGAFMTLTTERLIVNPYWRLLVTVGFVGGLTTFSSFGYETLKLAGDGNIHYAVYNIGFNFIFGMLATWMGIGIARFA
jgi:fluoride exporter